MPARERPPIKRSRACASTVLPAPVSPVSTFNPGPNASSARSISSRFSTRNSHNTATGVPASTDGSRRRAASRSSPTGRRDSRDRSIISRSIRRDRPQTATRSASPSYTGMAAIDTPHSQHQTPRAQASRDPLAAPLLAARLDEEIARAERHGTALSCLLVSLEEVEQLAQSAWRRAARTGARLLRRRARSGAAALRSSSGVPARASCWSSCPARTSDAQRSSRGERSAGCTRSSSTSKDIACRCAYRWA